MKNRKIKHKCFRWRVEAVMPTQGGPGGRGPTHCCDTHHTERFVFVFVFLICICICTHCCDTPHTERFVFLTFSWISNLPFIAPSLIWSSYLNPSGFLICLASSVILNVYWGGQILLNLIVRLDSTWNVSLSGKEVSCWNDPLWTPLT